MEGMCSPKTSLEFERTTRNYTSEYGSLHNHRCGKPNSSSLGSILSHRNSVHTLTPCILSIHYDIIHLCTPRCEAIWITECTVTDLINAFPGNRSVNVVQHATTDEVVFYMWSAPSSGGTTGLCNTILDNGSVNTFPRIGPCCEIGDVINNRVGVFRGVRALTYQS
jgi:hypothetical protein